MIRLYSALVFFFFFNDTATTEIYTLSLHDALPISRAHEGRNNQLVRHHVWQSDGRHDDHSGGDHRFEIGRAHVWTPVTRPDLVCRLLLEKKKTTDDNTTEIQSI